MNIYRRQLPIQTRTGDLFCRTVVLWTTVGRDGIPIEPREFVIRIQQSVKGHDLTRLYERRRCFALLEQIHHLLEGHGNTKVLSKLLDNIRILVVHWFCAVEHLHRSRNRGTFGHVSSRLWVWLPHRLLSFCLLSCCLLSWCLLSWR